jgi:hypothetical protein
MAHRVPKSHPGLPCASQWVPEERARTASLSGSGVHADPLTILAAHLRKRRRRCGAGKPNCLAAPGGPAASEHSSLALKRDWRLRIVTLRWGRNAAWPRKTSLNPTLLPGPFLCVLLRARNSHQDGDLTANRGTRAGGSGPSPSSFLHFSSCLALGGSAQTTRATVSSTKSSRGWAEAAVRSLHRPSSARRALWGRVLPRSSPASRVVRA